tara:strand:- start:478 stop:1617 length:1140 start_codon:yes stop_codon:yes gene_type:complete
MSQILDYNEINPESIVFEPPKKVKGGSYMTEIKYRNSDGDDVPFIIQTPRLISSEGIVRNDSRAHLELEFDKNHWAFYEFITNVDDHNIVVIEKHSEKWFTNKFPIDVVEEFYKTPVKLGRGKNPPKLKIKIPINRGEMNCNIFDNVKNPISYSEVRKNNKVVCVMQLVGLRFLKQQVICEWVPLQIKVCKESKRTSAEYMINDTLLSDYEDDTPEQTQTQSEPVESVESVEPVEQEPKPVETELVEQVEPEQTPLETESVEPVEQVPTPIEVDTPIEPEQVEPESVEPETNLLLESNNLTENESAPIVDYQENPHNSELLDNDLVNLDLETIDLSRISENTQENVVNVNELQDKIENLNLELSEKNRLIEQLKSLLIN